MARTVLIVDDDPSFRALLSYKLEERGFDAIEAGTARAATNVVESRPIDLAIVDNRLPDLPGKELVAGCRRMGRKFPVILLMPAFWRNPTLVGALTDRLGVDQILTKPLDAEEVAIQIEDMLGQRGTTADHPVVEEYKAKPENEELGALREQFRETAVVQFKKIEEALQHAADVHGKEQLMLLSAVGRLANKLHGMAGSYGFDEHSRAAARVGDMLLSATPNRPPSKAELGRALDAMRRARESLEGRKRAAGAANWADDLGQRVLLLEPEGSKVQDLIPILRGGGFEPHRVPAGMRILRTVAELQPRVVLMRMFLPRVSGFSVAKLLRNQLSEPIPLIGLTDRIGEDVRVAAYRAGCDDCVLLPTASEELLVRISSRIRRFGELLERR